MRIRWTPAAAADLERISDYLKANYPHYRRPTMRKLYDGVQSLQKYPYRGRRGQEEGTNELLFPPLPYIVVYRVTHQAVEILRAYHGAQRR